MTKLRFKKIPYTSNRISSWCAQLIHWVSSFVFCLEIKWQTLVHVQTTTSTNFQIQLKLVTFQENRDSRAYMWSVKQHCCYINRYSSYSERVNICSSHFSQPQGMITWKINVEIDISYSSLYRRSKEETALLIFQREDSVTFLGWQFRYYGHNRSWKCTGIFLDIYSSL